MQAGASVTVVVDYQGNVTTPGATTPGAATPDTMTPGATPTTPPQPN